MSKIKYKAIVSDIDGTLTQAVANSLPSAKVISAIHQVMSSGIDFSLATGRPYELMSHLFQHLGKIGPSICDNGAVIVDSQSGLVLWEANLPKSHANWLINLTKHFKLVRLSCDTGIIEKPNATPKNCKIRKVSVHDISMTEADQLIQKVNQEFKDITSIKAASYASQDLIDVYFSDNDATKQHGVFKLAEILNISTEEIVGIGDGYNDFPLLMACGLKVAMGNAVPELKAIADFIVPSVDEDGLAVMIEKYFLGN